MRLGCVAYVRHSFIAHLSHDFPDGAEPTTARKLRDCCGTIVRTKLSVLLHTIAPSGRIFVALRKAGRVSPERAPLYHAVTPHCRMALCASEPGAGSSWAEPPAEHVSCPECLRRLARLTGGSC